MPTISSFYGITVRMYWADHGPPHFHAIYGDSEATIDIRDGRVLHGTLTPRVLGMILEWARLHRDELLDNWELCATHQRPNQILPLE